MDKVFKIVLRYENADYICEGFCWFEEGEGWVSPFEDDGVRNCEHDYASLLPSEVYRSVENWGCEEDKIQVLGYWFEDKE